MTSCRLKTMSSLVLAKFFIYCLHILARTVVLSISVANLYVFLLSFSRRWLKILDRHLTTSPLSCQCHFLFFGFIIISGIHYYFQWLILYCNLYHYVQFKCIYKNILVSNSDDLSVIL